MSLSISYHALFWLIPAFVVVVALGRTFWVYRGSHSWPVVDGAITSLDVQRKRDAGGGPYIRATFTYEFNDLEGHRKTGTWNKNFSTEPAARDFAARELPIGKQVLVRFHPKDPALNDLELDSSTYTDDRPTSLGL